MIEISSLGMKFNKTDFSKMDSDKDGVISAFEFDKDLSSWIDFIYFDLSLMILSIYYLNKMWQIYFI